MLGWILVFLLVILGMFLLEVINYKYKVRKREKYYSEEK